MELIAPIIEKQNKENNFIYRNDVEKGYFILRSKKTYCYGYCGSDVLVSTRAQDFGTFLDGGIAIGRYERTIELRIHRIIEMKGSYDDLMNQSIEIVIGDEEFIITGEAFNIQSTTTDEAFTHNFATVQLECKRLDLTKR